MALMIGFIAAFIAFRKRRGQGRLKKLQKQLQNKQPQRCTLYQYPSKKIFSILFIIILGLAFQWFCCAFEQELKSQIVNKSTYPQFDITSIQKIVNLNSNSTTTIRTQLKQQLQMKQQINSLRKTLTCIHLVLILAIGVLVLHLDLRTVSMAKGRGYIKVVDYEHLGFSIKKSIYEVKQGDRLSIWEEGEDRFTNMNYYYSVRIESKKESRHLIKRSCMFDARTTQIMMGYQLDIPYSTKVKKEKVKK